MIRFYALALSAVALGVTAAVAAMALGNTTTSRRDPRPDALGLPPLSAQAQSAQSQLAAGLQAMAALQDLSAETARVASPHARPLLALPAPGTEVVGSVQLPRRSLEVFLQSLSDERTVVALDGQLVRPGHRLKEGGKVGAATPFRLQVLEAQGKQSLDMAVDRLAVGTLRWADGSPASVATQSFKRTAPTPSAAAVEVVR